MRRQFGDSHHFDKFTDRARQVFSYAQEEAQRLRHNYIGTEHLLLGLMRASDGIAARALTDLGVELNKARAAVEFTLGRGDRRGRDDRPIRGEIGLTPRAKQVIELAVDESRRFNHHYVGTEHILLGLIREGNGVAAGVLESLGVTPEQARAQVARLLDPRTGADPTNLGAQAGRESASVKNNVVTCRLDDAALSALDALVEAGVRTTRSDAAAWLIAAGIETHRALFDRVNATVSEIRRLRMEARSLVEQVSPAGQESAPDSPETPPVDDASPDDETVE
ncbi:MAG TPA: Clp protease N-terminal domain-containing protein [Ktedonobacterales bacterium]|nr:Clp protease N-terminal domain-containing protein [Ktedonobacterales bacterium]